MKTTFYCPAKCNPIREVSEDPDLPPGIETLCKCWRCPVCKQVWRVTVWFHPNGLAWSGRAQRVSRWRAFWGLA